MSNTKEVHSKSRLHVSMSTCYLEYSRHVTWLRRRRRRAYAPTSNIARHDNHEKITSWVTFSFLYGYGAPLGGPSYYLAQPPRYVFLPVTAYKEMGGLSLNRLFSRNLVIFLSGNPLFQTEAKVVPISGLGIVILATYIPLMFSLSRANSIRKQIMQGSHYWEGHWLDATKKAEKCVSVHGSSVLTVNKTALNLLIYSKGAA